MRKTLIALIIVLPLTFVLVLFSSLNLVSLGVNISVSGITIHADGTDEDGTLYLDLADDVSHTVEAEVLPNNATEKGYSLASSDPDVIDVTKDGRILAKREGTAKITATSNDKSFTDFISVVAVSSKPYDVAFSLFDEEGNNVAVATQTGYEGNIPTGKYSYNVAVEPMGFPYTFSVVDETFAEIEKGNKTLFLPFTGEANFRVTVPDGIKGPIEKTVSLNVTKPAGSVLINGTVSEKFQGIRLAYGAKKTQLYVECSGGRPNFEADGGQAELAGITPLNSGRYILDIKLNDTEESFSGTVIAGKKAIPVFFTFTDFDFSISSEATIEETENGGQGATLLSGNPTSFYVLSPVAADDVAYTWEFDGPAEYFTVADGTATVNANVGKYVLRVKAVYGSKEITKEVAITVVNKISVIQPVEEKGLDLAECYTVAGQAYNDRMELVDQAYALRYHVLPSSGTQSEDLRFTVSDDSLAEVEIRDGSPVLVPKGDGRITVEVAWKYNSAFGSNVKALYTFNVVKSAVAVENAPELVKAVGDARAVVLKNNIKLGTDATGAVLPLETRAGMLGRMKSTYNIEWYRHTSDALSEKDAYISYVMEFKNDVYGNGKSIDADNFTHVLDEAGVPVLEQYRRPLFFVKYKEIASVAGQDNCAFLIRTDGVKLYGVSLLGCSDASLLSENQEYDLKNLNYTGTTLDVNASAKIINCRIRNGRNVMRTYGGNRNGDNYFITDLNRNTGCDSERIKVLIEGCILSQGREFILKIGANRALKASTAGGKDPALTDGSGKPYPEPSTENYYGDLWKDDYFYRQYVMTDVTLKDSVLETSGLFTVGFESNFAGEYLYEGAGSHKYKNFTVDWESSGGTSFASVLHLEGDVRLYDWKDIKLVDSSTLIESVNGSALSGILKLDIQKMLNYVSDLDAYKGIIENTSDGRQFVHGGIALYGGGRNYSALDLSELDKAYSDFRHININISVLGGSDAGDMQEQSNVLQKCSGPHDFNFFMYDVNSKNNYVKQMNDTQKSLKYKGVNPVSAF